jgi:predicted transcriptional regulator of viral defense system
MDWGIAGHTITDPERTLIDGITMPQYCGDFAEALHAFQTRGDNLNLERVIEICTKARFCHRQAARLNPPVPE